MMDRTHNDPGFKVAAIIDNALADLIELGVESRDAAGVMLACQAIARIDDNEERRTVVKFAAELVWDVDDTGEGRPN